MKTPRSLAVAFFSIALLAFAVPILGMPDAGSGNFRAAVPVSPGEMGRESEASGACPTFSWSPGDSAATEIAVYELNEAEEEVEPRLVLSRIFPAGSGSWSPARSECLRAGGRFAWIVRALAADGAAAGEWSEARHFTVAGAPGNEEVAAALEVLRRRYEAGGVAVQATGGAGGGSSAPHLAAATRRQGSSARAPEGVAGSAAIRGELAGASGETYGVLGVSNSAAGAGLAATNNANGPDLRVDGSAAGVTDLALTEAGIDRGSPGIETFNIHNSGGGTMMLQVDGENVLTASALDWSGIANIPAGFADSIDDDTLYAAGNQLDLTSGTFGVVEGSGSGLDADTLDSLDSTDFVTTSALTWASVRRRFYLTLATFTGSQPLTVPACTTGFHMASLWEISDVSTLRYFNDPSLAVSRPDSGSGPPAGGSSSGWVRTGGIAINNVASPGGDNCYAWTSNSGTGTTVYLSQDWRTYNNDDGIVDGTLPKIGPWVGEAPACSGARAVWCVEN